MAGAASLRCQRWKDRRHSWRHVSEGGFNWRDYEVHSLPGEKQIKAYVVRHHYAASWPSASFRFGLFRAGNLVGAAVFGTPMQSLVLTNTFPELTPFRKGVTDGSIELSRFVLNDEVPANAESWFLARCFETLPAGGVHGVVAFSDPVPRLTDEGEMVMPGHVGIIYQASNASYLGVSTGSDHKLLPDGSVITRREVSKVRNREQGHAYVERKLIRLGVPPVGQMDPKVWLKEALKDVGAKRVQGPGKFRYAFRLGNKRERTQIELGFPVLTPYPKKIDEAA